MKPTTEQIAHAVARAIQEGGWTDKNTQWAWLAGFLNALMWTGRITVKEGIEIEGLVGVMLGWKGKHKDEPS